MSKLAFDDVRVAQDLRIAAGLLAEAERLLVLGVKERAEAGDGGGMEAMLGRANAASTARSLALEAAGKGE